MSLLEVLFSMFVLSVGLLGVAALIPVGKFAINQTGKADRSGACGHAALSQIKVRRMLDYRFWAPGAVPPGWWAAVEHPTLPPGANPAPPPATIPSLQPFAIDPLGVRSGLTTNLGGAASPIARITLRSPTGNPLTLAEAEQIFRWHDDLVFSLPEDMRPSPANDSDRPQSADPSGVPQAAGKYTWLVTVTPAAAEADLGVADKTLYSVSVAVCYGNRLVLDEQTGLPAGEHTAGVLKFLGNGYGGGGVQLNLVVDVKENEWIMLCGGSHCKWYRVVSAGEVEVDSDGNPTPGGTPVTALSLVGPDWDTAIAATAVAIDRVVGVYTTTVELDSSLLWSE